MSEQTARAARKANPAKAEPQINPPRQQLRRLRRRKLTDRRQTKKGYERGVWVGGRKWRAIQRIVKRQEVEAAVPKIKALPVETSDLLSNHERHYQRQMIREQLKEAENAKG